MEKAIHEITSKLQARGYRITEPRKQLIALFVKTHKPLSIQQLAALVASDQASVYRNIQILLTEKVIEEIVAQGKIQKYALAHGHHHHLVCTGCGKISHIPCADEFSKPKNLAGFKEISEHDVTYYGVCSSC